MEANQEQTTRTFSASNVTNEDTDLDSGDEGSSAEINKRTKGKYRQKSPAEIERLHYRSINERVVEDITLEALYKPHSLTVLAIQCVFLIWAAFTNENDNTDRNVFKGLIALFFLFLIISALVFPNGPFIRPHPIFWRIIFGISVLYALLLQFTLYQNYDDVKAVLSWIDPEGLSKRNLIEKEYAVNCSDVSIQRIWSHLDIFAVGHFLGWGMKALLIRHTIICWYISISWELTELVFAHLLPNFQECWWDAIILDVLICNGLGIVFGVWVGEMLEIYQFHWESIKNIRTIRGKLKRAVLQFTPESWITVNWWQGSTLYRKLSTDDGRIDENANNDKIGKIVKEVKEVSSWATTLAGLKRCFAIYAFIMVWLASELNVFFLKHVFAVDTKHPVVLYHIFLIAFISAPTIRQYYLYVTDPNVKRMGMQCWLYLAICALEAAICVKFGRKQLPPLKLSLITLWISFLAIGTVFCVWISVWWAKYSKTKVVEIRGGGIRDCYLDSSIENLSAISDDVCRRRRQLDISHSVHSNNDEQ